MLIGNVGREPEVRYVDSNMPVARISLATSEKAYTLKNGTQVPERTEWHRIVAWRDTAQFVEKLRTRAYNDKTGSQRNVTEIMAERIERLSPRAVQTNEDNTSLPQNGEQKL